MSISSTFYEQFFQTKVICAVFFYLQFGFVISWQNNIGAKASHEMLVKLLLGAFVPNRGWYLFGGNPNFTQSQYLQSVDGVWAIGDPFFGYDSDLCSVQVKV